MEITKELTYNILCAFARNLVFFLLLNSRLKGKKLNKILSRCFNKCQTSVMEY